MEKIIKNISVGTQEDCFHDMRNNWVVVHACKHPCHKSAVGYERNLQKTHKHYLTYVNGKHLYLNIIDSHSSFFPIGLFETSIRFIESFEKRGINVLIHCNQGMSRAPSIALVYLAKETDLLDTTNYDTARDTFSMIYRKYIPRSGIDTFLREHWKKLMAI